MFCQVSPHGWSWFSALSQMLPALQRGWRGKGLSWWLFLLSVWCTLRKGWVLEPNGGMFPWAGEGWQLEVDGSCPTEAFRGKNYFKIHPWEHLGAQRVLRVSLEPPGCFSFPWGQLWVWISPPSTSRGCSIFTPWGSNTATAPGLFLSIINIIYSIWQWLKGTMRPSRYLLVTGELIILTIKEVMGRLGKIRDDNSWVRLQRLWDAENTAFIQGFLLMICLYEVL